MKVMLDVSIYDMIEFAPSLSEEDALELILGLDLAMADVGFTEKLVTKLATSLKPDRADVDLPFIDWNKVESK